MAIFDSVTIRELLATGSVGISLETDIVALLATTAGTIGAGSVGPSWVAYEGLTWVAGGARLACNVGCLGLSPGIGCKSAGGYRVLSEVTGITAVAGMVYVGAGDSAAAASVA